jgi:FKBP-type peptidyl-prolyl cis-trans isomerase SlyD
LEQALRTAEIDTWKLLQTEWSRFITRSKTTAAPYSTAPPAAIRSFTFRATGNLVAGLEKALEGKPEGASLAVSVAAADGYGTRDESLIQRVPRCSLQGAGTIKKGMQFQARTDGGMRLFTVTAAIGDMVTLDGNHPLVDQTLHFDVQLVGIREATTEELEHGHVHGAGGHHH